jgi:hypothetical protein
MQDAYPSAVIKATRETKLDEASFAPMCPFAPEQVLSADFWPG